MVGVMRTLPSLSRYYTYQVHIMEITHFAHPKPFAGGKVSAVPSDDLLEGRGRPDTSINAILGQKGVGVVN